MVAQTLLSVSLEAAPIIEPLTELNPDSSNQLSLDPGEQRCESDPTPHTTKPSLRIL